jgi:hypothetical protein
MRADVLGLDPSTYSCHPLHGQDRIWTETNCAADLWIEALHALGMDPVAGLAFTLSSDFDGDQWRMFTFPNETLFLLYGIGVDELNVWRPLREHVGEQLALGNLVAFDADAWWLPDTAGLTYRSAHQKTTLLAVKVDTDAKVLGYLHNAGYYELAAEDFDALLPARPAPDAMPPYTLQVRRERPAAGVVDGAAVRRQGAVHLARRPPGNPVRRMAARIAADLDRLQEEGLDAFHRWAFGTVRQCGANAELASSFAARLHDCDVPEAAGAAAAFEAVAVGMKAAELGLARAIRGRHVDVDGMLEPLAARWESAIAQLVAGLAGELEDEPVLVAL